MSVRTSGEVTSGMVTFRGTVGTHFPMLTAKWTVKCPSKEAAGYRLKANPSDDYSLPRATSQRSFVQSLWNFRSLHIDEG